MPEPDQESITNGGGFSVWRRLESFALGHRFLVNVVTHSALFFVALLLAYLVWYDAGPGATRQNWFHESFLRFLPLFLLFKLFIFWRMKLFRGGWQYASIRDIANILFACWWYVLATFLIWLLSFYVPVTWMKRLPMPYVGTYFRMLPKGVLVLDFLATVFLVCTARLGYRLYREELRPISAEGVRRVLIVGAGNAAEAIIREIHRMRVERFRVVGLVDDDPGKQGITIHGIPVLGPTSEIRQVCEDEEIEEIIIAMPRATQKELRRVIELCSGTKLKFQSLPGVGDLIDGRVTVSQIRPVDINDLLGREAVELDACAVAKFIRNRRVLITGAGGSIGSEMCRQVSLYEPARLILVEQAETPLFDIENELKKTHREIPTIPCICDIFDRQRVMSLWEKHRPEVVIHAAAHKHVPLMEQNPCEAVKNNIFGSKNVADASIRYGAAEFVMISTDKAVNPSSIMGCSKRIAEIYTQSLNGRDDCKTQFKAVRFGNVLGSSGSVVPTFRKQIAAGGPVTVTHPEMTRYFMTIPEAAQLVLQAATMGQGGQIFLLDMGEPVKIVDLARQMITLSGFRPDEDIDIVFSGVRPGEKLFEELRTSGEDIEPTVHPKVMVWKHTSQDPEKVSEAIEGLEKFQNLQDRAKTIEAFRKIVPEYAPLNPPGAEGEKSSGRDGQDAPGKK